MPLFVGSPIAAITSPGSETARATISRTAMWLSSTSAALAQSSMNLSLSKRMAVSALLSGRVLQQRRSDNPYGLRPLWLATGDQVAQAWIAKRLLGLGDLLGCHLGGDHLAQAVGGILALRC